MPRISVKYLVENFHKSTGAVLRNILEDQTTSFKMRSSKRFSGLILVYVP